MVRDALCHGITHSRWVYFRMCCAAQAALSACQRHMFSVFTFHQVYRFTPALELLERMDDTGEISQKACPFFCRYLFYSCAKPERTLVEIYCVDAWDVLY